MPPGIANAAFARDQNRIPITQNGLASTDSQTLTGTGTVVVPIFGITGSVLVNALYGVVTTALGNCTAAFWRLNDGSATSAISLATGTTLTNFTAGSTLVRNSLVTVALVGKNASAATVEDPVAATAPGVFMPFAINQKTAGVASNIEFVFTTTDNPTTGAITFYLGWIPLTSTSSVAAL